jgi:hypothetical protein
MIIERRLTMRKKLVEEEFQIYIKSKYNFRKNWKPNRTSLYQKLKKTM